MKNEYLQSNRFQITCCSMTTRAMAAWTTLVRSRQSMQLTRKIPSCLHITPAWSTLFKNSRGLFHNWFFKNHNSLKRNNKNSSTGYQFACDNHYVAKITEFFVDTVTLHNNSTRKMLLSSFWKKKWGEELLALCHTTTKQSWHNPMLCFSAHLKPKGTLKNHPVPPSESK